MKYQAKYKKRLELIEENKDITHNAIEKRMKTLDNLNLNYSDDSLQDLMKIWNNLLKLEAWN